MFGYKLTRKGDTITLVIDLKCKDARESKSGKTLVVASSEGNEHVDGPGNFRLGLNVFGDKVAAK